MAIMLEKEKAPLVGSRRSYLFRRKLGEKETPVRRYAVMLTPQEASLLGRKIQPHYLYRPYTPFWLQDHTLPRGTVDINRTDRYIQKAKQLRERIKVIPVQQPTEGIYMELAELDIRGDSVNSPVLFNKAGERIINPSTSLPFPRSCDPDCDNFYDSTDWISKAGS